MWSTIFREIKIKRTYANIHRKEDIFLPSVWICIFREFEIKYTQNRNHQQFQIIPIEMHTGEKLFSCQVCGSAFSENSKLKTHMLIHTG